MSRLNVLIKRPKQTLGALGTVLAATAVVIGSSASWTDSAANPSNTFAAGSLSVTNSKAGAAILTASAMKPGDTATGTVDIENSGTVGGAFTLSRTAPVDSHATYKLSEKLNLTVVDCGSFASGTPTCGDGDDVAVYDNGTIAQMGTTGHLVAPLGSFSPSEQHRYRFTVELDSSADENYQDQNTSVQFDWTATS